MVMYKEELKEFVNKSLELVSEFSKINLRFLYISSK